MSQSVVPPLLLSPCFPSSRCRSLTARLQVPAGKTFYSMMFYFAIDRATLDASANLHAFVTGDDAYRNARLCMMPLVPEVRGKDRGIPSETNSAFSSM